MAGGLGRTVGNITATAITPVLHAVSALVTTMVTSLMSVLLPVICVAFLVCVFICHYNLSIWWSRNTAVSGAAIVQVAEQELADADRNIGGQKYKEWYGMNDIGVPCSYPGVRINVDTLKVELCRKAHLFQPRML